MEEHLVDYATFPTKAQFYMPYWDLCCMIIATVLLHMPYFVTLPCSSLASIHQNSRNTTLKTCIESLGEQCELETQGVNPAATGGLWRWHCLCPKGKVCRVSFCTVSHGAALQLTVAKEANRARTRENRKGCLREANSRLSLTWLQSPVAGNMKGKKRHYF